MGRADDSKESDIKALKDNDYDTSDVGRGNKAFSEKSVAKETDSSSGDAASAGHDARDDMEDEGWVPENRHG